MSNGEYVLAPTPIVRITAEQLEYLISRIRTRDLLRGKTWTWQMFNVSLAASASATILTPDKLRKAIVFSTINGGASFYPSPFNGSANVITIPGGQSIPFALTLDDFGWVVTEGWMVNNNTLSPNNVGALVISGPPSLES